MHADGQRAWFGTTGSKSRLNFLELLRAGFADYVINAEALAYMHERALAAHVIARLSSCFRAGLGAVIVVRGALPSRLPTSW